MKEYLVYGLADPRDGFVRYVGKSSSGLRRPMSHTQPNTLAKDKSWKGNWVRKLVELGLKPAITVLELVDTSDELWEAEEFWIGYLRLCGASLINSRDGGKFGSTAISEHFKKAATRASTGRHLSDEAKEKIAASRRGKALSEATKKKLSVAGTGRVQSPDAIAKSAKTRTGGKRIGTARENIVAGNKSPEKWSTERRIKAARSQGGRPIQDETGRVYQTQAEAARELGVPRAKVNAVIAGTRPHTGGHAFSFVGDPLPVVVPTVRKPHTEETKQKMSEAKLGKKRAPFSEEALANMSAAQTGREHSEETKEKIRSKILGLKRSEETKAKMRGPRGPQKKPSSAA